MFQPYLFSHLQGECFFLFDKAAYGTLVLINICVYNRCHMLKANVKIVVDIHKKWLKSIKICLQTSLCQLRLCTELALVIYTM
jgi:hypothetical protein